MKTPARIAFVLIPFVVVLAPLWFAAPPAAVAAPRPDAYWQVDDVKAGMKGVGRTVMKGTKVETFDAEVLGVLKNTSPGRDMVLCRLSGLGSGEDRRHRRHERQPHLPSTASCSAPSPTPGPTARSRSPASRRFAR